MNERTFLLALMLIAAFVAGSLSNCAGVDAGKRAVLHEMEKK